MEGISIEGYGESIVYIVTGEKVTLGSTALTQRQFNDECRAPAQFGFKTDVST
jgi:hypothetical protein